MLPSIPPADLLFASALLLLPPHSRSPILTHSPPLTCLDLDVRLHLACSAIAEEKTENAAQFQQYLDATEPLRKELGVLIKEELCRS